MLFLNSKRGAYRAPSPRSPGDLEITTRWVGCVLGRTIYSVEGRECSPLVLAWRTTAHGVEYPVLEDMEGCPLCESHGG